MKNMFKKALYLSTALSLGVSVLPIAANAAVETVDPVEADALLEPMAVTEMAMPEALELAQVTSVSELSDVQPGDWAFTALQRLVEEYGCLEGYPDQSYRGNRALTRYEFAAGLNACLDVVIQALGPDSDMESVRRLQEEFAAELATLRGRVDTLEGSVAELQDNQFSTTTQLRGYLDAHLVTPFDEAEGVDEADATFEYWSRLNLETSFTGEDLLLLSLSATDSADSLGNSEFGLNYTTARAGDVEDNLSIDDAYYSFPVGQRIQGKIALNSLFAEDFASSWIQPWGDYAVAAAGIPEFYFLYTAGDFGAGANVDITDNLVLDLAYMTEGSNDNTSGNGLTSDYSYLAQLNLLTDGMVDAAVVYLDGDQDATFVDDAPEYTLAGLLSLDFGRFIVSGHYAYSPAVSGGDYDSYMAGITFPDLFGVDNELGIYGGVSPAVGRDPVLVEAYYKLNVNDFFSLTPAVVYTDNDNGTDDESAVYGAVRASFSF